MIMIRGLYHIKKRNMNPILKKQIISHNLFKPSLMNSVHNLVKLIKCLEYEKTKNKHLAPEKSQSQHNENSRQKEVNHFVKP